jgi:hypothetical protein
MTMYLQLLGMALEDEGGVGLDPEDALAKFIRCRNRVAETAAFRNGPGWVSLAVADQLRYDVALIQLASSLRIPYDLDRFERADVERKRLESTLFSHSFYVDSLGIDQSLEPQ